MNYRSACLVHVMLGILLAVGVYMFGDGIDEARWGKALLGGLVVLAIAIFLLIEFAPLGFMPDELYDDEGDDEEARDPLHWERKI